jgi:hypothetical protein
MANEYFVLVTGNGESSRANIEALMEDHYYAKGENGTLVLAYEDAPTKSQTLVAQYAKACNKNIMVFCHEDAQTLGIHGVEQNVSPDPVFTAVTHIKESDATAFLLWDEKDDQCFSALKHCQNGEAKVPAFNLCDGLVPLNDIIRTPIATPKVEEPVAVEKAPDTHVGSTEVKDIAPRIDELADQLQDVLVKAQEIVQEMIKCRQSSL